VIIRSDTSRLAHQAIKPHKPTLREMALEALARGPSTADEAADYASVSPFAMRPRFTELHKAGKIEDTGERRTSSQGKTSAVWRLVNKPVKLEQGDMMADLLPPVVTR
jgi:predicted ArsR family transcriptional regulator